MKHKKAANLIIFLDDIFSMHSNYKVKLQKIEYLLFSVTFILN